MSYPAKKSRRPSSPPIPFLDGRVVLRPGDCLDVLDAVAKSKNNLMGAEGTPLFDGAA